MVAFMAGKWLEPLSLEELKVKERLHQLQSGSGGVHTIPGVQKLLTIVDELKKIPGLGAAFAARTGCSGLFVSERTWKGIREHELSGVPSLFFCDSDSTKKQVTCSMFGLGWMERSARYMDPVRGCRLIGLEESPEDKMNKPLQSVDITPFEFERGTHRTALDEVIANQFTESAHQSNQSRALVVVHKGKVVGQGYSQHVSVTKDPKLLGWSMTKSVHALIIGAAITQGMLTLDTEVILSDFSAERKAYIISLNGGKQVTFGDLIRMSDILEMAENYAIGKDVSQMLYGSEDAADFASGKSTKRSQDAFGEGAPLGAEHTHLWEGLGGTAPEKPRGGSSRLGWYYSSGLSNVLAKEFRGLFATDEEYWMFPQKALFGPIGADDFVVETDAAGTFLASSLSYATALNWAKLGQLVVNKGQWGGKEVLSSDFVEWALTPHPHSAGVYGGSIWLNPTSVSVYQRSDLPSKHDNVAKFRWMSKVLPADAFAFSGFQEQMVLGVPSLDLVIVRIGFTKKEDDGVLENEGLPSKPYSKTALVRQILEALQ
jgi:CubicO group peptidase (beta-lactamase class C family)